MKNLSGKYKTPSGIVIVAKDADTDYDRLAGGHNRYVMALDLAEARRHQVIGADIERNIQLGHMILIEVANG